MSGLFYSFKGMFRKNSIFLKVLIPVTVVMLLQTLVISTILFANGTIESLGDSAIETMRKNAENRSLTLEDMMIHYWSNFDKLETDASATISDYLALNGFGLSDVLGNYERETDLLSAMSSSLISALRQTSSTGVFMYFIDPDGYVEAPQSCNGLYYRDSDPVSTPADNSDIMYLRGHIDIARKDRLQLDSLWRETFTFTPEEADEWKSHAGPQLAAANNPGLSSSNLSYWGKPRLMNPGAPQDAIECVTYTRPLIYDGQVIAIIGSEIQVSHLLKYMPANDIESTGKSGYILIEYDTDATAGGSIPANVYIASGSYIKRIVSSGDQATLVPTRRNGVYSVAGDATEGAQVTLIPIKLYNSNTYFVNEQWALAAIGADSVLFESSRNIRNGLLYSSVSAIILGTIAIAITIRMSTRPLITMADQIKDSGLEEPIAIGNTNTYEVTLLCSTINAMRERRSQAEARLREERERYLIALESTSDTFMEYNIADDSFMLYYFEKKDTKPELSSSVVPSFMQRILSGEISHPDDIPAMNAFFSSAEDAPVQVRILAALFNHIKSDVSDGDYYWFLLKASHIHLDGGVSKLIGTAREITKEKLIEHARAETARRDSTTGLYNRDYGLKLMRSVAAAAAEKGAQYSVVAIYVDGYDTFEAYYGRAYAATTLMTLSHALLAALSDNDVCLRYSNDCCLVLVHGDDDTATAFAQRVLAGSDALYFGESPDLRPRISAGVAGAGADPDGLAAAAYVAARHAAKTGALSLAHYDALPPYAKADSLAAREKPVSVSLDISRDTIVGFVLEFFEHTPDVHSAMRLLLSVVGDMYGARRAILCTYDADFGTNQITYQWQAAGVEPCHTGIEKISLDEFSAFENLLDENGVLSYDSQLLGGTSDGIRRMLCAAPGDESGYCCAMYENGVQIGQALLVAEPGAAPWSDADLFSLYEISKIIAARLSIERSNSANRAKSEFLSRVSHEIRTPMNAIIGMTDIAINSSDDRERVADCLGKIDFSAKHLLSLINDVLEMSRIESGKLVLESAPLSLSEFITGIDTLMRRPIEAKGLSFIINANITHDTVIGDEHRLRQVLVNLLGNANKFTEPGGEIVFSIDETGEPDADQTSRFRFSVLDNGAGISQEDQPRVFKAFEQAESSSSTQRRQGTGLGLAISGNIISAMGSKIELVSKLGEGSEFFFTLRLPLCDNAPKKDADRYERKSYAGFFTGKRALLAEDNDINIEIASYILKEAGMDIDVAVNGAEAVRMFAESADGYYDVILMDIQMPVMDGLEATRNIRRNPRRADARVVPIIAMTANAFNEDMKKSIESGMNGHIAKPIDTERLYALLRQLINT